MFYPTILSYTIRIPTANKIIRSKETTVLFFPLELMNHGLFKSKHLEREIKRAANQRFLG